MCLSKTMSHELRVPLLVTFTSKYLQAWNIRVVYLCIYSLICNVPTLFQYNIESQLFYFHWRKNHKAV